MKDQRVWRFGKNAALPEKRGETGKEVRLGDSFPHRFFQGLRQVFRGHTQIQLQR